MTTAPTWTAIILGGIGAALLGFLGAIVGAYIANRGRERERRREHRIAAYGEVLSALDKWRDASRDLMDVYYDRRSTPGERVAAKRRYQDADQAFRIAQWRASLVASQQVYDRLHTEIGPHLVETTLMTESLFDGEPPDPDALAGPMNAIWWIFTDIVDDLRGETV